MENNKDNDFTILWVVLIFVGIFMFLYGFIYEKATKWYTKLVGWFVTLIMEILGFATLFHAIGESPMLPGWVILFVGSFVLYLLCVIAAHRQDNRRGEEMVSAMASFLANNVNK